MRYPLIAVALITAACASVQPLPIRAGDTCFECREVIAEPRLAAELIDANGRAYMFSCAECMAKYLVAHPEERPRGVFVADYESGEFTRADSATFVLFTVDPARGKTTYAAFRETGQARAFAAANRAEAQTDWPGVLKAVAGN